MPPSKVLEGFSARERVSREREALSAFQSKKIFVPKATSSGFWRCGGYLLNYRKQPLVMGILNVTPDSFSDGGLFLGRVQAVDQALRLEDEGADVIDIGGESTRPGSVSVSLEEESRRVLPVIQVLSKRVKIPLSVDTRKAELARRAIDSGASIINDVSGLREDPEMLAIASPGKTGLVIMHSKQTPRTMQKAPRYRNVIEEIHSFLEKQVQRSIAAKIALNRIVIDPGIGFGKTLNHNLTIIQKLNRLTDLGVPVMLGPSRKSFIGELLDLPAEARQEGGAAAIAIALFQGARIFRVHDVAFMKRVVLVAEGIRKGAAS